MLDKSQLLALKEQLKGQFKDMEKASSKSFFNQKNIIKQVLAGKHVKCQQCQQVLSFYINGSSVDGAEICCAKGCTSIALDLES